MIDFHAYQAKSTQEKLKKKKKRKTNDNNVAQNRHTQLLQPKGLMIVTFEAYT